MGLNNYNVAGAAPYSIEYRMKRTNDVWQVYDLITEGVSLVTNYRTTFKNEIARSGSVDSVIRDLVEKNKAAFIANAT